MTGTTGMRCITTLRRYAAHLAWVACVLSGCAVVAVGAAADAALPGPTDAR